ncbi:MAG: hypothetical protein JNM63_17405 [Spirochaetia bacterium]|nr:hypothetical protein [Spirochaetia bacterium]
MRTLSAVLAALVLLSGCAKPAAWYGEHPVMKSDWDAFLSQVEEPARTDHLRKRGPYERLLRYFVSNAVIQRDAEVRGYERSVSNHPEWGAYAKEALLEYLSEEWFPASSRPSKARAREATTLYRISFFSIPSPNTFPDSLHPETEKVLAAIRKDFEAGLSFEEIGKRRASGGFYPSFPPFDTASSFGHFTEVLSGKKPGTVIREWKLPGSYVWLKLLEKTEKSGEELAALLEESSGREAVRQNLVRDRLRRERKKLAGSSTVVRYYDVFEKEKRKDLREDTVLALVDGEPLIYSVAAEKIFRGRAPSATAFAGALDKGGEAGGFSPETFFIRLEDLVVAAAEDRHYRDFAGRDAGFLRLMQRKRRDFITSRYADLYTSETSLDPSRPSFAAHLTGLRLRFPIELCPENLPAKLFPSEQRELARLRKDRGESALLRLRIEWDGSPAVDLERKALVILGDHSVQRKKGKTENPSVLTRADLLLQKAFRGEEVRRFSKAVDFALRFHAAGDILRTREWLQRSRATPDFDRRVYGGFLRTNEVKIVLSAIEAAGFMGDPAFMTDLLGMFGSQAATPEIRCFAAEALGRLPEGGQTSELRKCFSNSTELWGLRMSAGQAIENLTGENLNLSSPKQPL